MTKAILGEAKKTVQLWLAVQLLTVGVVASISFFLQDLQFAKSVFIGGMVCFLPNVVFARSWFSFFSARYPQQMLLMFYAGECVKFFFMLVLFLLVFKFLRINVLACLLGFISAQVGLCLGAVIIKKK